MQKFRDVLEIETKVCHKVINKQSEVIKSKEEYIDILEALIVDHHLTEEVQERIRKGKQEYGKAPKVKAVAFKVNQEKAQILEAIEKSPLKSLTEAERLSFKIDSIEKENERLYEQIRELKEQ